MDRVAGVMTWYICTTKQAVADVPDSEVAAPCDLALLAAVSFLLVVSLVKTALSVRDLFVSLSDYASGDDGE